MRRHSSPGVWLCVVLVALATAAKADLVGYWPFDEDVGTASLFTPDASGRGNDGQLVFATRTTDSQSGNAVRFNGVDAYVDLFNYPDLDLTAAVTVSAWVKREAGDTGFSPIIGKGDYQYMIRTSGGQVQFFTHDGSWHQTNGATIPIDEWHHVAGVCDGSSVTVYVDAVQGSTLAGGITTDAAGVNIGRNSSHTDRLFLGVIDEVAVWNEALPLTDIQRLAAGESPLNVPTPPPPELTWDGTLDNPWASAHWIGPGPPPPPDWPDATIKAVINSGRPRVAAADATALILAMTGGELVIGNGGGLTIAQELTTAPGSTITMEGGSQLAVNGTSSIASLRTAGDTTITGDGLTSVLATTFTDQGIGARLTKLGTGTLKLNDGTGGGVLASATTFDVQSGILHAVGANPLGAAGSTVDLDGGTFTVEGGPDYVPGLVAGEISANWSFEPNPGDLGIQDRPWHGLTNVKSSSPLEWRDNTTFVYTGQFYDADGIFAFGENIDDNVSLTIDGTEVIRNQQWNVPTSSGNTANNSAPGAGTLDFGMGPDGDGWHDFEVRFSHGGGGAGAVSGSGWTTAKGFGLNAGGTSSTDGGDYLDSVIDPGDASLWRVVGVGAIDATDIVINVLSDSTLNAISDQTATFGTINFNAGTALTTTGAPMTILDPRPAGDAALVIQNEVTLVDLDGTGNPVGTLAKRGPGDLILDATTAGAIVGGNTTIRVEEGTAKIVDSEPVGPAGALVELAGGILEVTGSLVATPGLLAGSHSGNPWMAGANPGNLGIVLGPQGLLRDGGPRDAEREAHWLAARADGGNGPDNTTLIYTGEIYLAGTTTFAEQNDDVTVLSINGQPVLNDTSWDNAVSAVYTPPGGAGWYDFEVRFSNGGGGYGFFGQQNTGAGDSNWDAVQYGFGMAAGAVSGENALDYTYPEDPGDASLFRTQLPGPVNEPDLHLSTVADSTLRNATMFKAQLGHLTLSGGAALTTTGSDIAFTGATVDGTGALDTENNVFFDVYNDGGGAARRLIKRGDGLLILDNSVPGTVVAGSTTLEVEAGTLRSTGARPLGASPEVVLDGGTLEVRGLEAVVPDALKERWFDGSFDDGNIDPIDPGANPNSFLALTPGADGLLDELLSFTGSQMNTRSGGLTGTDYIGAAWVGRVHVGGTSPLAPGAVTFGTRSDDGTTFWVDVNRNDIFEPSELVVNNKGFHGTQNRVGTVTLAAGAYNVAMGFYEGSGGEFVEARYAQGTVAEADYDTMTTIDPTAWWQAGLWSAVGYGAVDATDTDITVTANSTLRATTDVEAAFGTLTLNNGTTLTTRGGRTRFADATVLGTAALNVTNQVSFDTYDDGGGAARTLIKQGGGILTLDNSVPGTITAPSTNFEVEAGVLLAIGENPLGSGPSYVTLDGGTLELEGTTSIVPGLVAGSHSGDPWTAGPNPGNLGICLGPQGLLRDGWSRDAEREAHWLAARADGGSGPDNTTLIYSGEMYLPDTTTFVEQNDDNTRLYVDGQLILSAGAWNNANSVVYTPSRGAGWYDFEVRFSNGGGGYGFFGQQDTGQGDSNWDTVGYGFGIAAGAISDENALDYTYPEDPGDASLFRTRLLSPIDASNLAITVTADSALTARSQTSPAVIGSLTLNDGTQVTTSGVDMAFNSVGVAGGAGRAGAINHSNHVAVLGHSDGGVDTTIIKRGSGTMTVANTVDADSTNWRVEGGLFLSPGTDPLGANGSMVTLAGGTYDIEGQPVYSPGLLAGSHSGNPWTAGPNPGNLGTSLGPQGLLRDGGPRDAEREAHWLAARDDGGTGPDNTTLIYTGQINLAGTTTFVEQNDDVTLLWVDGQQIINNGSWNDAISATYDPPGGAGWYDFEVRFSNGGGGYGFFGQQNTGAGDSNWDAVQYGFGIAAGTVGGENALDYTYPEDPGDASLFRQVVVGPINEPDIHIGVDGPGGTLNAVTAFDAHFGQFRPTSGMLTIAGAPGGVTFTSGAVDPGATGFTLNNPMDVTVTGPFDGQGATATFTKIGAGQLTLAQGTTNHNGVSVVMNAGTLVTQADMGVANLTVNGSALVQAGANAVEVAEGGVLKLAQTEIQTVTATTGSFQVLGTVDSTVAETLKLGGPGTVATCASMLTPVTYMDIGPAGDPQFAGTHSGDPASTLTMEGGGSDIWDADDSFHYAFQRMDGDGVLTARVVSVENTDGWAKAGVMFRDDLTPGSKHSFMAVTPANGVPFQGRNQADSSSGQWNTASGGGQVAPYWVRVERAGQTFTGYRSLDGLTWETVGSQTYSGGNEWDTAENYFGLAVTAHNNSTLATAVFDNISGFIFGVAPPPVLNNVIGEGTLVGDAVTIAGTLAPGVDGPGAMSIDADLTLDPAAVFAVDVQGLAAGTGYDQLTFLGDLLNLNGALLGVDTAIGAAYLEDQITVTDIINASVSATGLFTNPKTMTLLNEGDRVDDLNGAYRWEISYQGGTGNDIVLTLKVIPEPCTLVLVAGGAVVLALRRRRRRRV